MTAKKVPSVQRAQPNKGTIAVNFSEGAVAHCMKCNETVEIAGAKKRVISGKTAVGGTCPSCGTKVFMFPKPSATVKAKTKVAKKPPATARLSELSSKAKRAYAKLEKAGLVGDCWCGQTKSGKAIWWEGDAEKGWTICHDPIPDTEMPEFKKLVVKSL